MKYKNKNPNLSELDRLTEMFPPKRMVYWPYLVVEYEIYG